MTRVGVTHRVARRIEITNGYTGGQGNALPLHVMSFAAGIFVGAALFDVFPEVSEHLGPAATSVWMATGLFLWWLQKVVLHRFRKPNVQPLIASTLWFHSILEGIVTGLAFGVSRNFGLLVLAAMTLHLLPEFFAAVALMYGAGSKTKTSVFVTVAGFAILYISFSATYFLLPKLESALPLLLALSGGAFFYVGGVSYWRKLAWQTLPAFLLGLIIPALIK